MNLGSICAHGLTLFQRRGNAWGVWVIDRLFLRHPRSIGESYVQHLGAAMRFALDLFGAAAACLLHALVPGLFERSASRTVARLHAQLKRRVTGAAR